MTARTYTAAEVQAIARRAWEAGRDAGAGAVGVDMDRRVSRYVEQTTWDTAYALAAAIRALQPPPDMGDIIGGEDDR